MFNSLTETYEFAYKKLCAVAAAMLNFETGLSTGEETLARIKEILADKQGETK